MQGTPFGRYRLVELLGRGGMGEVWRAYDTAIDRVVALKVLPANFADDQVFQERLRREARAAAGLDEPHVVPIFDFGEIEGRLFVTMRLIKGRDLQQLLGDGPLPPDRAVGIIEQIAAALHAAHEVRLVHRDVKPSNILVTDPDFAYLIDFGIARAAGEIGLTSTGATMGTWAYLAPERLNTGCADARADIYALACVLYEALTGQHPYPGDSLEQQIVGHLTAPPPRPSTLRPAVPESLDIVLATGMAQDPDHRYATTIERANAAREAITEHILRSARSRNPHPAGALDATRRSPASALGDDQLAQAPDPVSQHAGDRTLAATPLRPSGWSPQPQPQPTDQAPPATWWRQRRPALIAAAIIVIVAAAGITGYLLRPHSPASQTPTALAVPPPGPTSTSQPMSPVTPDARTGCCSAPTKPIPQRAPLR